MPTGAKQGDEGGRALWSKILMSLFAALFLLLAVMSALLYGLALTEWLSNGFNFKVEAYNFMPYFAIIATCGLLVALAGIALLLRLSDLNVASSVYHALLASAALLIVVALFMFESSRLTPEEIEKIDSSVRL